MCGFIGMVMEPSTQPLLSNRIMTK